MSTSHPAREADPQPPLQQADGGGLGLDDDLDRLVEQRVLVRVELAVVVVGVLDRAPLGRLEQRLVELLLALVAALLDDQRHLFLATHAPWTRCRPARAERLEEHVPLTEQVLRPGAVEDHAGVGLAETAKAIRLGTFALIMPVITSTDGRWVASTRWMPTARDFCASRMIGLDRLRADHHQVGELVDDDEQVREWSSPRALFARFASGRLRARTIERRRS